MEWRFYAVKQRNRPWWTKGKFKACDVTERSGRLRGAALRSLGITKGRKNAEGQGTMSIGVP